MDDNFRQRKWQEKITCSKNESEMFEDKKDNWYGGDIARKRVVSEQVREEVRVLVVQHFGA